MISLLYIFSLCFLFNGVEDCSWGGEVIEDRDLFENKFISQNGLQDRHSVAGFVSHHEHKVIIYNEKILETTIHEIGHLKCWRDFENHYEPEILKNCHFNVDLEYNAQSRPDGFDEWQGITDNTPPLITQKMAYQELIFSNQYR